MKWVMVHCDYCSTEDGARTAVHILPHILYQGCPVCKSIFRKLLRVGRYLYREHHIAVSDPVILVTRILAKFPRKETGKQLDMNRVKQGLQGSSWSKRRSPYFMWFQPSVAKQMITALFWAIGQRVAVINCRRFGTCRSRNVSKELPLLAE
jgi:hypothetical protein